MLEVYCCQHNSHCMLASFLALFFSIWWSHHNQYYHHPHHHHHHHDLHHHQDPHHHHHDLHHHHHDLHHHHHLTARSSSPLASVFSVVEGMLVCYYFFTNYILVAFELLLFHLLGGDYDLSRSDWERPNQILHSSPNCYKLHRDYS